ncbi:MAG: C45 family autoproteolytic acyltransferase/hydrolase [Flavobacteriales bacterium]|nr:C45 family autoproteolytic acyltransferase/hydrolase [Flavobacteriales bacterium]
MSINRIKILFRMILLCVTILYSCGVKKSLNHKPNIINLNSNIGDRIKISDTSYKIDNNFILKNEHDLWELKIEGDALERVLIHGSLTKELFEIQEESFMGKIDELVPSKTWKSILRHFLSWYNRKIYLNVPNEYKAEIFGLSKYASDQYDYIAEKYLRLLYFHGAHDIGHALQDLALVGCSSFAAWDNKTEDGELLIGRNFDFYAGDKFAENKIVAFINPDKGYKYMSVTWAGMIGVVSGMNEKGLTVTINSGKSSIPISAKTPISLLTREILQYASNINEAIDIAKKRKVFVSEAILIGSSKDNKAITIEVSPKKFGVYEVKNDNQLICSNHFQSKTYYNDRKNNKQIKESHSKYRYERMEELIDAKDKLNVKDAVSILRNTKGLKDVNIGYGNEKSLNHLLAHHSIVFKPDELKVWVSSNPYQLGEFVCYDLNKIFDEDFIFKEDYSIAEEHLTIDKDSFVNSIDFKNYNQYRILSEKVKKKIKKKEYIFIETLKNLKELNSDYWEPYFLLGEYYYYTNQYNKSLDAFNIAQSKEIPTISEKKEIEKYIKKLKKKLNYDS